jgi:hypothetical protein
MQYLWATQPDYEGTPLERFDPHAINRRGARGTCGAKKEGVRDLADRRVERLPSSKLGVVVPTGFEPVF